MWCLWDPYAVFMKTLCFLESHLLFQNKDSSVCWQVEVGLKALLLHSHFSASVLHAGHKQREWESHAAAEDPKGSCPATQQGKQKDRNSCSNWLTTSRMSCKYWFTWLLHVVLFATIVSLCLWERDEHYLFPMHVQGHFSCFLLVLKHSTPQAPAGFHSSPSTDSIPVPLQVP